MTGLGLVILRHRLDILGKQAVTALMHRMAFPYILYKEICQVNNFPGVSAGLSYTVNCCVRSFAKVFKKGKIAAAEAPANRLVAVPTLSRFPLAISVSISF